MLHPRYYFVLVQKTENSSNDVQPNDDENIVRQEDRRIREIHVNRSGILFVLYTFYVFILTLGTVFATFLLRQEERNTGKFLIMIAVVTRLVIFVCINYVWGIGDRLRSRFYNYCKREMIATYKSYTDPHFVTNVIAVTGMICGFFWSSYVLTIVFFENPPAIKEHVPTVSVLFTVAALCLMVKGVPLRIWELMGYVSVPPTIHT
jgi:uncharacterized protein YqhQ